MTKYIKIDWPEYQYFMEYPDFREICFFVQKIIHILFQKIYIIK